MRATSSLLASHPSFTLIPFPSTSAVESLRMAAKVVLATLLAFAPLGLAVDPPRQPHQPTGEGDRLLTFNETSPSAKLRPSSLSVDWSSAGGDGNYIVLSDDGDLVLEDIVSEKTTKFVTADKLPKDLHEYWISGDAKKVLAASNYTKQ